MAFRSKLARHNCCEQIMPVAVMPICAISCIVPQPICELPTLDPSISYSNLYSFENCFAVPNLQLYPSPCPPPCPPPCKPCGCSCNSSQNPPQNPPQENIVFTQPYTQVITTGGNTTGGNTGGGNTTVETIAPIAVNAITYTEKLEPVTGDIVKCQFFAIPETYLYCDGQAHSRITYKKLFDTIGEKYGKGNGTTTFNVPNLVDVINVYIIKI